jgi:2-methylisocitrate lyase-like PEP mutase family enzyme
MNADRKKRLMLKDALAAPDIALAPACADVSTARLVERMGIAAIHGSGSTMHRTAGYADAGYLTMTEMANRIRSLNEGIGIPVIADADTGFGGPSNVVRMVREYERAGAAAIHIEDQLTPKRPTHAGFDGNFVSRAEMVDKIRAAVDTREDENLLIISRCDVDDWDEKLERLVACRDAGADCGWIAAHDPERIREIVDACGTPCIGVLQPSMSAQEFQAAGAALALIPTALEIAALCAQMAVLESLKATGTFAECLNGLPNIDEMRPFYTQQGTEELKRVEAKYNGEG